MNRLVLIGTKGGPAVRQNGALPTSSLLDLDGRRIVVDCGLGVTQGLVAAGMDLRDLDLILITHLHSDHILELGPLVHTAWTTGLARPVTVWGPPGIEAYFAGFMASMAVDNAIRVADEGRTPLDRLVTVRRYAPGVVFDEGPGGLKVSALEVPHPPLPDCHALRIDGSRSVTFSGDTAHFPPLARFAADTDVLVHEAMLPEGVEEIIRKTGLGERLRAHLHASHTTVEDAARIALGARAGHLVLNHLIPADDPRFGPADWTGRVATVWNGPVTVGRDGLQIPL